MFGQAELHFSDVKRVTATHPRVHFALEVEDWDEMLTSLDAQRIEALDAYRLLTNDDRVPLPQALVACFREAVNEATTRQQRAVEYTRIPVIVG